MDCRIWRCLINYMLPFSSHCNAYTVGVKYIMPTGVNYHIRPQVNWRYCPRPSSGSIGHTYTISIQLESISIHTKFHILKTNLDQIEFLTCRTRAAINLQGNQFRNELIITLFINPVVYLTASPNLWRHYSDGSHNLLP